MSLRYKIRYRRGKTEIIIESNDKAYIDEKLTELGAEPLRAAARKKPAAPRARQTGVQVSGQAADLSAILAAIRGATNSGEIQRNILGKKDRLARILLCYYFASATGQPGLTTRDVEALTDGLGGRIAQPNVGKVIRLGGKKYLNAGTAGGAKLYSINQRGREAIERVSKGESLS